MGITILGGINQGLLWAVMAIGVFITFRLLDFADLTCEGSFALGGAVTAALIYNSGWDGNLVCFISLLAGGGAGFITAILHTKLKIAPILSGIITLTALYSVTYIVMGNSSSIGIKPEDAFFAGLSGMKSIHSTLILGLICIIAVIVSCYWFFGTEIGSSIRATGMNERMSRAQGVNTDNTKIIGLVISNALIALSGSLVAQSQGAASWGLGQGAIVAGLAAVIIGENIVPAKSNFAVLLVGVSVGSIIYRIIYALVYYANMPTEYIKLCTAILVVIALCLPMIKTKAVVLIRKTDSMLRAKNPKYAAYAAARDTKAEAKKLALREKRGAELASLADAFERAKIADDPKAMNARAAESGQGDGFVYMGKWQYKMLQDKYLRKKEKYVEKYGSKALAALESGNVEEAENA